MYFIYCNKIQVSQMEVIRKKCVKCSFSLYLGPFIKAVKVVFYMHLYTLERIKDKISRSGQKRDLQVLLY